MKIKINFYIKISLEQNLSVRELRYKIKNKEANLIVSQMAKKMYKQIAICGEENLKELDLSHGAIITANHFNPLDSLCERKVVEKLLKRKMYTVIQDTNLAMLFQNLID